MFVVIILMRIIPRRIETSKVRRSFPWVMIYGRRKTGKTFLVENFLDYDNFYFVNRDGSVLDRRSGEVYTYSEFMKVFREILGERRVVIDEFHRLPERFLDYLHASGIKGNLILITSTLWLSRMMLEEKQPLLGMVRPVEIGLVDEREILLELSREFGGKDLIENSVYLREVMLLPFFRGGVRNFISDFLSNGFVIKGLVGEIFSEEEKELTNIYEGVMKCVADGKNTSTQISDLLFSKGLISKNNPGVLQKYLSTLTEIGILERLEVFRRKKFRYFHRSPLIDLFFFLESKYSYTEIETPRKFIRKVVDEKVPYHVEQFLRNLFSKLYGMQHRIIEEKDCQIDVALFRFKKLKMVAEVKWKNSVSRKEVRMVEKNLNRFRNVRKVLIVPEAGVLEKEPEGVEVLDAEGVLQEARERFVDKE